MSFDLPSQAKFWGIGKPELQILYIITYYLNNNPLSIDGEDRRISTHHDLPLEDMFLGIEEPYEEYERPHMRLLNNGLLQEEYVCRRKIDWAPTQEGRQAIRDVLHPWSDELQPSWAEESVYKIHTYDRSGRGPLFGDPNEGVTHRKGVEVAGWVLQSMAWTYDMDMEMPYGLEWYPTDRRGESCHDLHVKTNEYMNDVGVEVVTDSNNMDRLVKKWKRFQKENRTNLWIFDRRETACKMYNALYKSGDYALAGRQFRNYSNWSAKLINEKVWKSSEVYPQNEANDVIQTVTGLLEGRGDMLQNLFEDFYSSK
ncbi:hypothetical protein [Halalkalirubrum salinum]|uniref:hypothetical protein n=1 Tax=Halalkalirubrum salinum TaxID=2563889 RepID=UPI0010FB10E0|nr:hypothetical protein [Halalkalirubrum salinum]